MKVLGCGHPTFTEDWNAYLGEIYLRAKSLFKVKVKFMITFEISSEYIMVLILKIKNIVDVVFGGKIKSFGGVGADFESS